MYNDSSQAFLQSVKQDKSIENIKKSFLVGELKHEQKMKLTDEIYALKDISHTNPTMIKMYYTINQEVK